ncbi:response regulator transcription factor [Curvibacter sp. PAE-UM]|uniref:response regulator transcription factor n=1 Tax=Curvibacter sp. PAE-UM TaxID=1714344 RepID=UPI0009E7D818|nr:response regulator [Curvibacter sp. PAE-UM]
MTLNLLIIEDDENKLEQVRDAVNSHSPNLSVSFAKSYQSGLRALLTKSVDIVILDMTLPTFDRGFQEPGGRTRPFAGREIIEQLDRKSISTNIVVVSGFEILGEGSAAMSLNELDKQLAGKFGHLYRGFVYYSPSESAWRGKLELMLSKIVSEITK